MARPAQDITESELAVLRVLWERERATIRHLADALYPGGGPAQYATVQKLLERMEAKGYVHRDRSIYVHVFTSAIARDELIGRRLRALAETLCDGSLTPLLNHLARSRGLSERQLAELQAILDESDGPPDEGGAR